MRLSALDDCSLAYDGEMHSKCSSAASVLGLRGVRKQPSIKARSTRSQFCLAGCISLPVRYPILFVLSCYAEIFPSASLFNAFNVVSLILKNAAQDYARAARRGSLMNQFRFAVSHCTHFTLYSLQRHEGTWRRCCSSCTKALPPIVCWLYLSLS